jgi:hypothetical protein
MTKDKVSSHHKTTREWGEEILKVLYCRGWCQIGRRLFRFLREAALKAWRNLTIC